MSVEDTLLETEEKMMKTEEHVQNEFLGVRTGKASPALVENVMLEAYGTPMRLRDVAGISAPEPRMILIQPWDVGTVSAIEKGIQAANLGLNPAVDGKVIRVMIPELSEERRQEFVKLARKMAEDGRVAVRHERRQAIDQLKEKKKNGEITEDELSHGEKEVQKLTDNYIGNIDRRLERKDKEIMTI